MDEMTIYRQQWKGKRTGWDYELWIVPSGTAEFTDFTFTELPFDTFIVEDGDTGFDKRTIGVLKQPILEIEHSMFKTPLHSDYDLLRTMVLNPAWKYAPSGYTSKVQAGTTYYMFCTGGGYTGALVFAGVQQSPAAGDYDLKAQKLKIRVLELNNLIQNSISMHDVAVKALDYLYAHSGDVISKNCYFNTVSKVHYEEAEFLSAGDYNACVIMRPPQGYTYYYGKRQLIWDAIALIMKAFYNDLGRGIVILDSAFKIQPPLTSYFKQKYLGDGTTNGELSESSIYMLIAVAKPVSGMFNGLDVAIQNEWKGGYFDYKEKMGLFNSHSCVYDYLKDVFEDSLCKSLFTYDNLMLLAMPMYNDDTSALSGTAIDAQYTSDDPISIDLNDSYKIEYKEAEGKVGSATSSLSFSVGSDIQKYDSKSNASQNETNENIPIIFNNMPEGIPYEEYSPYFALGRWHLDSTYNISSIGSIGISSDKESGLEHLNGLFYLESGSPFTASNMVRVHEQCSTIIKTGDYTGTIPNNTLYPFTISNKIDQSVFYDQKRVPALMVDMQLQSCKPKIQADAFKQIYKSPNLAVLVIEIGLEYGDAKPNSFWYRGFTKEYTLNIGTLYPALSHLGTNGWYLLNSKINFQTERAELEFINATYTEE